MMASFFGSVCVSIESCEVDSACLGDEVGRQIQGRKRQYALT
jgi:hypothetical protein